jgi:hypothetical protein
MILRIRYLKMRQQLQLDLMTETYKELNKNDRTTRGIKNCRYSRLFKGCSPLQLLCNLTGNRTQSATFHTATVGHYIRRKVCNT